MKYVFQLVKKSDGTRTAPFVLSREDLVNEISSVYPNQSELDDFYVLVLANVPPEGDLVFSQEAMMLGSSFQRAFRRDPPLEQPVVNTDYRDWYGGFPPDEAGDNRRSSENE